jgi:hypothetical protein
LAIQDDLSEDAPAGDDLIRSVSDAFDGEMPPISDISEARILSASERVLVNALDPNDSQDQKWASTPPEDQLRGWYGHPSWRLAVERTEREASRPSLKPLRTKKRPTVTAWVVAKVFKRHLPSNKKLPDQILCKKIAEELSAPWREPYHHGAWALRHALSVILDDAPKVIEAEEAHRSLEARERQEAWKDLLVAAQRVIATGVRRADGTSPHKRKEVVEERERKFVFHLVNEALKNIDAAPRGTSAKSAAIKITSDLLALIGVTIECEALSKQFTDRK